jgi:hypothetical protein
MVSLEYIWDSSDEDFKKLPGMVEITEVIGDLEYMTFFDTYQRLKVIKALRSRLTSQEQSLIDSPGFGDHIIRHHLSSTLREYGYTTISEIWRLRTPSVMLCLKQNIDGKLCEFEGQSLPQLKVLLLKEFRRRDRVLDGHLLDLPQAFNFLLHHGVNALRLKHLERSIVSEFFDDINLADIIHQYCFEPKYLYLGSSERIYVIDPKIRQIVRVIRVKGISMIKVIGLYGGKLYITGVNPEGSETRVVIVSLSLPTVID